MNSINAPDKEHATLLVMPAWIEGPYIGVKLVNVFPSNSALKIPSISGNYLLSCGQTGVSGNLIGGFMPSMREADDDVTHSAGW